MDRIWGQAREELQKIVGADSFSTWIEPLRLTGVADGTATIICPTRFLSDWVSRHYSDDILKVLDRVGGPVQRLQFETRSQTARQAAAPAVKRPAPARPAGDEELAAPLDSRFTFENFIVGKPNELAHAAARRVAEGGPVTFNPLFLYGGVGLGKTHLMHAIAREIQIRQPEARVLYLSAEQFMYRFVQALRDRVLYDRQLVADFYQI